MSRKDTSKEARAARLRLARSDAGYITGAAAARRFGWKASTYLAHENGQNGINVEAAETYGNAYAVDGGWILTGAGRGPKSTNGLSNIPEVTSALVNPQETTTRVPGPYTPPEQWPRDLPVMGLAECGQDGWSLFNGEIIQMAPRPPNLAGVTKAYSIYTYGKSMEPRYFAGELLHIHPHKPVEPGDFVLVQIRPEADGEAPRAVVKRLVRRSGNKAVFEQYNPAKTVELKLSDIVMHLIVGSARG